MEAPIYDVASSCLVCGMSSFSMLGIELLDVASNCSMWRRTFRRGIELFDVASKCWMLDIEM